MLRLQLLSDGFIIDLATPFNEVTRLFIIKLVDLIMIHLVNNNALSQRLCDSQVFLLLISDVLTVLSDNVGLKIALPLDVVNFENGALKVADHILVCSIGSIFSSTTNLTTTLHTQL